MPEPASWRYLEADAVGAAEGLAADEATLLHYGRGAEAAWPVTLRLYTYRPVCALVGRYQSLEDEIDLDYCTAHDVEVGRRPTGGGAIIMGPGQLGVAVAARAAPEETPRQALQRWAGGVVAGLERLGIEAQFRRKNDLEVEGRKIAGLGLYLDPHGAALFHSSVLVDLDVGQMLRVLRIPGAKLSDKAVARVEERVTTVSGELGKPLTAVEIRREFGRGFAEHFGVTLDDGAVDDAERQRLGELVEERFGNPEWIFQRSPRRDARGSAIVKTPAGLVRIYVGVHGDAIKSALVAGDFNQMPPGVPRLEAALRWCRAAPEAVLETARQTLSAEDLGVEPEAIGEAVWQAAEQALALQNQTHPLRDGSCYFPEAAATATAAPSDKEAG